MTVTSPNDLDPAVDLVIVDASYPLPDVRAAITVIGSRSAIAELTATDRAKLAGILTYPLSREPLWHVVAVALGLEAAEVHLEREDLAFAPPDVEEARRENALILVAEDNETNQIVIRQMLSKMGFACDLAENGQVALDMLEQPGYGLLLTDFNMPVMDGFELSRRKRGRDATYPFWPLQRMPWQAQNRPVAMPVWMGFSPNQSTAASWGRRWQNSCPRHCPCEDPRQRRSRTLLSHTARVMRIGTPTSLMQHR